MNFPLKLLTIATFILVAMPQANFPYGPAPIYAIDLLLIGACYYGGLRRFKKFGRIPHSGFVICILTFALLSEFLSMFFLGSYIESIYMTGRLCVSVSVFFLVNNLIRSEADLLPIIKAAVAGMLVTAFLMAMTSLPGTRNLVAWVFGIELLTPSGDRFFKANETISRGIRGQSLVGYNIISAWFVALIWPLAIALYKHPQTIGLWRRIAQIACFLGPFGVIFSYSRGAILGLLLIITALLIFGEGRLKTQISIAIIFVVTIITFFGWDSDLFYFERIERRTRATIENPFASEMESERFYSYIDPFIIVSDNPMVTLWGEGLTVERLRERAGRNIETIISKKNRNVADHSVFSKATLSYGMLAAFCYLGLWASSTLRAYAEARISTKNQGLERYFPQLVFASVFGLSAWIAFDKGIIIQPRGAMMFFLITGLVGVCQNLRINRQARNR